MRLRFAGGPDVAFFIEDHLVEEPARSGVAASPGGQLAATVSVIVFAFLIAGLASKRGREE